MGFVKSLYATYEGLVKSARLLGSRPNKPLYTAQGGAKEIFLRRLRDSGGNSEMAVDGSTIPVEFYIQPPSGEVWYVAKWMIYIQDDKGFAVGKWGSNGVLNNGVLPQLNGHDMVNQPFKTNGDIESTTIKTNLKEYGNTYDVLVAEWDFKESGTFIRLTDQDKLSVLIQDDLTVIESQHITAHGFKG